MQKDSSSYGAVRPSWDKKDCSVRAVAVAIGATYEQASAIYAAAGRQTKKATPVSISITVCETWLRMIPRPGQMRLAEFVVLNGRGSFVVRKKGHMFAIIDGVVQDWEGGLTKPGTIVESAWEVTEETKARLAKALAILPS
jgi:hypothetical protein